MRINPVLSFNVKPLSRKLESKISERSTKPLVSDVINYYAPTLINFRGKENFREQLEKKLKVQMKKN